MKLYDRFADKGFHSSVATTFGLDFEAYETIVLSRLRGVGCRNNMVIADGRMLTHALSGAMPLPQRAGQLYSVTGIANSGVFHPKLFLQFGRKSGRLFVGSANLTAAGLAGNLELVGALSCSDQPSGEQQLIRQAWNFARSLLPKDQRALTIQLDWMRERTPWLKTSASIESVVELSDGSSAALLSSDQPTGIGQQFVSRIREPVRHLLIVSPYWDSKLHAVSLLQGALRPKKTSIVLDTATSTFPIESMRRLQDTKLYDRAGWGGGRFIHAKLVVVQTSTADHVLFGSANCTTAALGTMRTTSENQEVCLYRRFQPGKILAFLGIDELLSKDNQINEDEFEPKPLVDELPLSDLAVQTPGRFEFRGNVLTWHPAAPVDADKCKVELLDQLGDTIPCTLELLPGAGSSRRYQVQSIEQRPAFARLLRPNGTRTAPAIVAQVDLLRTVMRESRSSRVESALRNLDDEPDASLLFLEVLDLIERLDAEAPQTEGLMSIPKSKTEDEPESQTDRYAVLPYDQFIAGRRDIPASQQRNENSLSGSESSAIRNALNRLLGMQGDDPVDADGETRALEDAFNLGDEPDGSDELPDSDSGLPSEPSGALDPKGEDEKRRARQKATREQIVLAVKKFGIRIKSRQGRAMLDNQDLLRFAGAYNDCVRSIWFRGR